LNRAERGNGLFTEKTAVTFKSLNGLTCTVLALSNFVGLFRCFSTCGTRGFPRWRASCFRVLCTV